MSSSTSSSERAPFRLDRSVITALALLFVGLEIFTRTRLFDMSKDFRRFRTYEGRAARLAADPAFQVALIGNSATDRGVDGALFAAALSEGLGQPVAADLFVADQSRINTWHFMLERFLFRPGRRPDLTVVGFYEDDLQDGNPIEIGRVAQFFTTIQDWPAVFRLDLPQLEQQAEFVVSSFWATYAARERVKERALGALLPGYQPFIEGVNAVNYQHNRRLAGGRPGVARTHHALTRLLDRARQVGARLCFVAYPTLPEGEGPPYEVAAETVRLVRAAGMDYLDLRRLPPLTRDLYADEVHLSEAGRPVYTRLLAQHLSGLLRHPDHPARRQAHQRPAPRRAP